MVYAESAHPHPTDNMQFSAVSLAVRPVPCPMFYWPPPLPSIIEKKKIYILDEVGPLIRGCGCSRHYVRLPECDKKEKCFYSSCATL